MDILKALITFLIVFIGFSGFSQSDLDEYKYVIVPKRFESFKNQNEHQTSTLVKYLFTEKGFNATYDDNLPTDLRMNRCLGLSAHLKDDSNMFTTKTTIVLKDCNGNEVFKTIEGKSKEKEYKEAFTDAITEAMSSFSAMDYKYDGKAQSQEAITVSFKNDVKTLKEEKAEKRTKMVTEQDFHQSNSNPAVTQVATQTTQYYKDNTPVDSKMVKGETGAAEPSSKIVAKEANANDVWYAQPTANGYQLVDSSPKIRMQLLKTSGSTIFLAQQDAKDGVVHKKNGVWIFEYYENGQLVEEELNIKF